MKYSLQFFLNYTSIWIVIAPLFSGLFLLNYLKRDSKLVLLLVAFACVPQFLHVIAIFKKFEAFTYNFYTILEFLVWLLIFKNKLVGIKRRIVFMLSVYLYCIFSLLLLLQFSFVNKFISEWVCLNNILFTFWILFYILNQFKSDQIDFSFTNSFTWYISFEILYSSCTFLVFSFWYYKENNILILNKIKILHNIFNILLYVGFCRGFFLDKRSQQKGITI